MIRARKKRPNSEKNTLVLQNQMAIPEITYTNNIIQNEQAILRNMCIYVCVYACNNN